MKLYGSYNSPFVRHCRIVILETDIECEFIETDWVSSAVKSPTKRVPFLEDGEIFLTDSSAILMHLRQKAGLPFLTSATELDHFCMINAALDSTVNLFVLERDGIDINRFNYTIRQAERIKTTLAQCEQLSLPLTAPYNDVHLRLGCYVSWALFRQRISIDHLPRLQAFMSGINQYPTFSDTAPPAA